MSLQILYRRVSASTKGAISSGSSNSGRFKLLPPMKNLGPTCTSRATISSSSILRSADNMQHQCQKVTPCISSPITPKNMNINCTRFRNAATQCRSYVVTSTSSTNSSNDSNPKNNNSADALASTEEMDQLLANVLIEAKEISALAIQRKINLSRDSHNKDSISNAESAKNEKLPSSGPSSNDIIKQEVKAAEIKMEIQDEINAAEALLRLTNNHTFRRALSLDQERSRKNAEKTSTKNYIEDKPEPQEQNVTVSLHSAFVLVVNWLCSTLASCPPPHTNIYHDQDVMNFPSHLPPGDTSTFNSLPTKESILLKNILYLQERSRLLNLPLTIPQYQTIASMIARYSTDVDLPIRILDISTAVSEVYGNSEDIDGAPINTDDMEDIPEKEQIIQSQFFDGALKELLERNRMRDMIDIFQGMKALHDVENIDPQIGIELLTKLKTKVDDSVQGDQLMGFDEVDAMELTMILQKPVMDALDSRRKELVHYQQIVGETLDSLLDYDNDDDQDGEKDCDVITSNKNNSVVPDEGSNSEYNDPINNEDSVSSRRSAADKTGMRLEELVKIWVNPDVPEEEREAAKSEATLILNKAAERHKEKEQSEKEKKQNQKINSDGNQMGVAARFHVDNKTGEVENIEFILSPKMSSSEQKKYDRMQNELLDCLVYARDSSFQIPDVVDQLEEWNDGNGLQFTKEYKAEIAKEIFEENGDIFNTERYNPDDSKDDNRTT